MPSAARLTRCSVVPGEDAALDEQEEPVQHVPEEAEEEDARVHLGYVELALLIEDVGAETVLAAGELGDDDHHEADRERDAKTGDDRRERGGGGDAEDTLDP